MGRYSFRYTKTAEKLAEQYFVPLMGMNNLHREYTSETLFPFFINRVFTKSRPEYQDYLSALGFEAQQVSPMQEMARSSGIRATDNFQLFPYPEKQDDRYEMYFFSRGVRYMEDSYVERSKTLNTGDNLKVMIDVQNDTDPNALLLRTADNPPEFIGYCPWFLCPDFNKLIEYHRNTPKVFRVTVEKANPEASAQLRLLCKVTCPWPKNFTPFSAQAIELATLEDNMAAKESEREKTSMLPVSRNSPNAETLEAFKEIEEGKSQRFDSVEALMADLHA